MNLCFVLGSLNLDVGINNISGLINNEWVKKRLRTMPALKPLVLIIRGALSQRGLNDASQHGLSSFAVVCMCVFFLQVSTQF
jgi:non-canonical poly(A) RNA polymerase PAPD5/7